MDLYRTIAILLGLLTCGAVAPAHAQLGLGLVPMRSELRMAPGQSYSGSLKLSNESGEKTRIRAEVLDFNIDSSATPQFERNLPEEAAYSCRKWLSLNPMEMELDKGGFVLVRYTLRLPAELAPGSYNCAAGFSTRPPAEQQLAGMGVKMAVRIVSAFYVIVGNPPIEGGLKEIKIERMPRPKDWKPTDPEPGWRAVVVMENRGFMHYRPEGDLLVLDEKGEVVERHDFTSLPVLPKREQRFIFPLSVKLPDGKYTLQVRVDVGTHEIQEASLVVSAGPPK